MNMTKSHHFVTDQSAIKEDTTDRMNISISFCIILAYFQSVVNLDLEVILSIRGSPKFLVGVSHNISWAPINLKTWDGDSPP